MNRVWAYVLSKPFSSEDLDELREKGEAFVKGWTAHQQQLTASFDIFRDRIVVVRVNEGIQGASGCSIDKLTRFIKECSDGLGIDLFDRLQVVYEEGSGTAVARTTDIPEMLRNGLLNPDTPVYNTSVASEEELEHWKQPLKNTWLKKYLAGA